MLCHGQGVFCRIWVLLSAMDYLVVVYRGSDLTGAYTIDFIIYLIVDIRMALGLGSGFRLLTFSPWVG